MPLFDLKCTECGEIVEKIYPNHDKLKEDDPKCDSCGGSLQQSFTTPVSFKIKGYCYNNEYNTKSMYKDL